MHYKDLMLHSGLSRLEANLLMVFITGQPRSFFIAHDLDECPALIAERFLALSARRLAGEPIAHIIEQREFYARLFKVTADVLIPRPETEHLIDYVLHHFDHTKPLRVLDLGTGSGCIAITLALECPLWQVQAIDISEPSLLIAQENAQRLQANVDFLQGSWFDPVAGQTFDIIVSNPPYIDALDHHLQEGDVRFEPRHALTDEQDGLSCLRIISELAPRYLNPNGALIVEHGFDQKEACQTLFAQAGFTGIETLKDLANLDRITLAYLT